MTKFNIEDHQRRYSECMERFRVSHRRAGWWLFVVIVFAVVLGPAYLFFALSGLTGWALTQAVAPLLVCFMLSVAGYFMPMREVNAALREQKELGNELSIESERRFAEAIEMITR